MVAGAGAGAGSAAAVFAGYGLMPNGRTAAGWFELDAGPLGALSVAALVPAQAARPATETAQSNARNTRIVEFSLCSPALAAVSGEPAARARRQPITEQAGGNKAFGMRIMRGVWVGRVTDLSPALGSELGTPVHDERLPV